MTPEERAKAKAERLKKMDARKAAELEGYERAAKKAQATLDGAGDAPPDFPYFVRKHVEPCRGLKLGKAWKPEGTKADGTVVPGHMEEAALMPLQDLDGRTWSYQAIFADGTKAHMPKGRARGSFFVIPADEGCEESPIVFLEGLATGLTVHEATGTKCVVCCDCGNILPVASEFVSHGMLGECQFDEDGRPLGREGGVLLADNDHATKRPKGHPHAGEAWNPGLDAVKEASRILRLRYQYPPLEGEMNESGTKALSDYNDLACLRGIDAVRESLDALLPPEQAEQAQSAGQDMPPEPEWLQEDVPPPPACPADFGGVGHVFRSGDLDVAMDSPAPAPARQGDGGDLPIPLRRKTDSQADYPVEAFGPLAGAVDALARHCFVHPSVAGGVVLTYLSMLAQRLYNVQSNRYSTPLSLYTLMIMDSGEGKTDVERIAGRLVRQWEADQGPAFKEAMKSWRLAMRVHEKAVARADKDFSGGKLSEEEYSKRLAELEDSAPPQPLSPILTSGDVNVEGLYRMLRDGRPSHGIFAAEGGRLFGGVAFSAENKLKTVSTLADLWSGDAVDKLRQGEGASKLPNRRVAVSLMVQPVVAEPLYGDATLSQQGFLSRFLTTWPSPRRRGFINVDVAGLPEMRPYYDACQTLLNLAPPENDVPGEELMLSSLELSGEALDAYVAYQDSIEDELDPDSGRGMKYDPVRIFARRSAEQAIRIAGVLTAAWEPRSRRVLPQAMKAGIKLASWHLNEILRIILDDLASPEIRQAEALLEFLWKKGITRTSTRQLLRFGPTKFREKKSIEAAVKTLAEHRWLRPAGPAEVWMGDNRQPERAKKTWFVVPESEGK